MKAVSIFCCVAAASVMVSQGAIAKSITQAPVYAKISPPYRLADVRSVEGDELVRVTQISATDTNGQQVVLFSDKAGAVLPRSYLDNVAMLINPVRVEKKGEYSNLNVTLANETFSIKNNLVTHASLTPGLGGTLLKMQGSVQIGKFEVTPKNLRF